MGNDKEIEWHYLQQRLLALPAEHGLEVDARVMDEMLNGMHIELGPMGEVGAPDWAYRQPKTPIQRVKEFCWKQQIEMLNPEPWSNYRYRFLRHERPANG